MENTVLYHFAKKRNVCMHTIVYQFVFDCCCICCYGLFSFSDFFRRYFVLFCFGYFYISSNDSRLIYIYVEAFIVHSCCVCLCVCATVCHQIIAQDIDHWQANNLENKDRMKTKKYTMLCGVCVSCL